jgi:hypothetical protein
MPTAYDQDNTDNGCGVAGRCSLAIYHRVLESTGPATVRRDELPR